MSGGEIADVSTAAGPRRGGRAQTAEQVPALTLVSHPATQRVGERALLEPLLAGREVALSRNAPDFARPGSALGVPLLDPFVSRTPIVFAPAPGGGVRVTVPEDGTPVVAGTPLMGTRGFTLAELAAGVQLELADRVVLLLHLVAPGTRKQVEAFGMVGESAGIQLVREHIQQISDLNVPVLVRGETGTGKELVARAVHQHSPRRGKPFVSVNLGAIPKELAAAELFGAKKGAFTGATHDRDGFFLAAQGGTLFLDEVGEAPPEVQVMLLRVLETGELYPVGARTPVSTDVRLIAATDANLEEQIRDGRFKAPLLHRLAGYEIRIPPLRERREDIGPLFHHFASEELRALGEADKLSPRDAYAEPWLPAAIAVRLLRHPWPGNIRQLRNLTRQLVIGSRGEPRLKLDPRLAQELDAASPLPAPPPASTEPATPAPAEPSGKPASRRKPSDVTEAELLAALRESAWDLKAAGDRLGIPRSSIYDLIDKSPNLRTAGDLSTEELTRCFHECQGDLDAMVQRLEVSKRALGRRLKELGLSG
ncbi:MAG TPA: sigma-54 dependent transcriptional regulator [Myxococcaceae bacterium]|nr:sigma-54 dependent transcriptional regulator [Myxococcaceae bacterium]